MYRAMGRYCVFQLQKVSQSGNVLRQGRGQAYVTRRTDPLRARAQRQHPRLLVDGKGALQTKPRGLSVPAVVTPCPPHAADADLQRARARRPPPGQTAALAPPGGQPSVAGNKPCRCPRSAALRVPASTAAPTARRDTAGGTAPVPQVFQGRRNHRTKGYEIYFDDPAAMASTSVVLWRAQV